MFRKIFQKFSKKELLTKFASDSLWSSVGNYQPPTDCFLSFPCFLASIQGKTTRIT